MAGDGTLPNPLDGNMARWTREGSGACRSLVCLREACPGNAERIVVHVRDLCPETEGRHRDAVRAARFQTAPRTGRVMYGANLANRFEDTPGELARAAISTPAAEVCPQGAHV